MQKKILFLSFFIFLFFLQSCEEQIFTPKPRAYPKIDFPEKTYRPFSESACDFKFEVPDYAVVKQDSNFFDEKPLHPCWYDLDIPQLNCRIYLSYAVPGEGKNFDELRADAFELANKHNIRASYIDEFPVQTPNDVEGIVFDFEGPSATPFQFFLTDSLHNHFLRGSLYSNSRVRPDSIAPVYDFLKSDIMHLINTFEWEAK